MSKSKMPSRKVIENPDPSRLALKSGRMRVDAVAKKVGEGTPVFISGMGRQLAFYYKKRLTALVKQDVDAEPAFYEDGDGHRLDGYRFRVAGKKKG